MDGYPNDGSDLSEIGVVSLDVPPVKSRYAKKSQKKPKSSRHKRTPIEARTGGAAGKSDDFQLSGDKKVATVISRLANRLRNRLSSLHYKEPESRPKLPDAQQENFDPSTNVDLSGNPDFNAHQRADRPEKSSGTPPHHLHPAPRGWAPASNMVPRAVIPTSWGRAKGVVAIKKSQTLDR